jgi:hypothetical protein
MINSALFLFIILLLGLVLCSFLGGKNCLKEGMTTNTKKGQNGAAVKTATGVSGNTAAIAVGPQGNVYTASNVNGDVNATSLDDINQYTFNGPNGGSAKVTNVNGTYQVEVTDEAGNTINYTYNPATSTTSSTTSSSSTSSGTSSAATIEAMVFYGPYGGKAQVVYGSNGNYLIRISYPNGQSIDYTTTNPYVNNPNIQSVDSTINQGGMYPNYSTSAAYYPNGTTTNSYNGAYGGSAGTITGPFGNTIGYATGPMGNTVVGASGSNSSSSYDYSNSLPPGIPRNMIPPGQEDLYILKSEVVPPVCPACPTSAACPREEKCPPCPACARCPEPSFECKKVPNYNAINNQYLPVPVVNDFSTFGM